MKKITFLAVSICALVFSASMLSATPPYQIDSETLGTCVVQDDS